MYDVNDTIVAVSSASSGPRVIVRMAGPDTLDVCNRIFNPPVAAKANRIVAGSLSIDAELDVDAKLYVFLEPRSYTGDTLAEIHLYAPPTVTEALVGRLLARGVRTAGPGEFTARAYLNGKIDLAQAEAVNEIVVSSNGYQLAAAERLLSGQLGHATEEIQGAIMDCLTLIEAGLDFSGEDIEFITRGQAVERLTSVREQLRQLLAGSISYESAIDLPAVGIAGAPNAGKSSLLNKLLGRERSIVSERGKTTRDVLSGLLTMVHSRCVLFDCAGLVSSTHTILDELAQQAAMEALHHSSVVVFCVDVAKTDFAEDVSVRQLIEPQILLPVATKSDLLTEEELTHRRARLSELFGTDFVAASAQDDRGVDRLREIIDSKVVELGVHSGTGCSRSEALQDSIALTARHRQAVTEAIESVNESVDELKAGNDEIAAMMLRAAYQAVTDIEQQHVDEQVLDRIFSSFCIGK
ncbi:MAG: 50S ribosome-binding GTPase [Phycisphaerales bacterium]|nr:MAG: 50S ribosome-binding GTPase [Phycisphaerales bacterium]